MIKIEIPKDMNWAAAFTQVISTASVIAGLVAGFAILMQVSFGGLWNV